MPDTDSTRAKKRFGQHFLTEQWIIDQIVDVIAPNPKDHLIEIGPGLGAITLPLLPLVNRIDAIELDRDVIPRLVNKAKGQGTLRVHQEDALGFQLERVSQTDKSLRVVGNLPYNIATPLLFHLFDQKTFIIDMHFMVQKEVGLRLTASPSNKHYGRLSVMAQYHCDIEPLLDVPPNAFTPPPKVDSLFIRLIPKQAIPVMANDLSALEFIVKQAFSQRRKTLANTLKKSLTREQITSLGIDPQLRPENLAVDDFVRLSNLFK